MRLADGGRGAEIDLIVPQPAAHRAFELFRDDEPHALDRVRDLRDIRRHADGVILRQHLAPVEELAVENAAHERCVAHLEQDVLRAKVNDRVVGVVRQNFFALLERRRRGDEAQLALQALFREPAPQRQPVAVHRHDRDALVLDLKQAAGVHRAREILACRKDRAGDHLAQLRLRDADALVGFHVRQLRVIVGAGRRDGKRRDTAADGNLEIFVHLHAHRIVRQLADDVKEQPRGHDARARLGDVGVQTHGDARFQIVARQHDLHAARLQQDPLQRGDGALLRHRARGDGDRRDEPDFFTGEFHFSTSFPLLL